MHIEYFYAAHSAFAYLGSARFLSIAERAGRRIVHRPVDLDRVLAGVGIAPFAARTKAHMRYYFGREIERWSEYREAPVMPGMPAHHAHDYTLANRLLIAAAEQGAAVDRLSHLVLEAHWRDDADLADPATLARLAQAAGCAAEPLLAAARSDAVAALHEAYTQEAIDRSVFGSPTYCVAGDMFYGQDRLELLERALVRPFAGSWPRRDGQGLGRVA